MTPTCYHCGLPVPPNTDFTVHIDGANRAMCCPGCQAVAETILASGLTQFYQLRTATSGKADVLVPEELDELLTFDREDVQKEFVHRQGTRSETSLSVEGMTCAACAWLIEKRLVRVPGVLQIGVNSASHRLHLVWDQEQVRLSALLQELAELGYRAFPFESEDAERQAKRAERQFLARLGVAGLGMMQAMMYAANLYAGPTSDIAPEHEHFLHATSLLVTLPVVTYSAWPFYVNAWRNLKQRHLVMDLPVSLALLSAFFASAWAVISQTGEIYFDSVTMFVFFLLVGRYLERRARLKAQFALAGQRKLLPRKATRLTDSGEESVLVRELVPGDRLRVKPGETLAADGTVCEGSSSMNEAFLTGEPLPQVKTIGDTVVAGSINVESPLVVTVERIGADTQLSALMRLQAQAQTGKPRMAELADRIAGHIVLALLLVSLGTYLVWHWLAPANAFWITLSVLVVTCPCALSLATPVALTTATATLARRGFLIARGHALETLAAVTHVVMDKTGTLTHGHIRLHQTQVLGVLTEADCRHIAAALESGSEHPIARAFAPWRDARAVTLLQSTPGAGVEGSIGGTVYRIGQRTYVEALAGAISPVPGAAIYLGCAQGPLAAFHLDDSVRPEAKALVAALRAEGLSLEVLSGDPSEAPQRLARELGLEHVSNAASPADKLARIRQLEAEGAVVLMVGDGVNDAPVLAGAAVSVAMGSGADLAKTSADMILLNNHLERLADAVRLARKTRRIIRENLWWALAYNVVALPAAAMGWVPPWLAAAGMSASSLVVVLNALRLADSASPTRPPAPRAQEVRS